MSGLTPMPKLLLTTVAKLIRLIIYLWRHGPPNLSQRSSRHLQNRGAGPCPLEHSQCHRVGAGHYASWPDLSQRLHSHRYRSCHTASWRACTTLRLAGEPDYRGSCFGHLLATPVTRPCRARWLRSPLTTFKTDRLHTDPLVVAASRLTTQTRISHHTLARDHHFLPKYRCRS